jgi:hypothetical protein
VITSSPIIITVNPPLAVTLTASDVDICVGDFVQLNAVGASGGDGNYTYTWIPGIGSTPNPPQQSPTITTNYVIILSDGCGTPVASDTATVVVNPTPVALFTGTQPERLRGFDFLLPGFI